MSIVAANSPATISSLIHAAATNSLLLVLSVNLANTIGDLSLIHISWHNAASGKYGLVELKERYKEIQLPEIIPVDIKEPVSYTHLHAQVEPDRTEEIRKLPQAEEL